MLVHPTPIVRKGLVGLALGSIAEGNRHNPRMQSLYWNTIVNLWLHDNSTTREEGLALIVPCLVDADVQLPQLSDSVLDPSRGPAASIWLDGIPFMALMRLNDIAAKSCNQSALCFLCWHRYSLL